MRRVLWVCVSILCLASLTLLFGCGGGGSIFKGPIMSKLLDAAGRAFSSHFDVADDSPTALTELSGFAPGQRAEVMVYRNGEPLYKDEQGNPAPQLLSADANGKVSLVAFYDLGWTLDSNDIPIPDPNAAGQYTMVVTSAGKTLLSQAFSVGGRARADEDTPSLSVLIDATPNHYAMGSIKEGSAVYVRGDDLPAGRYALYVVGDQDAWKAGDTVQNLAGDTPPVVTVGTSGKFDPQQVWAAAHRAANTDTERTGDFDVIAHKLADGVAATASTKYAEGDAVNGTALTGFTVQGPYVTGPRYALVAARKSGTHIRATDELNEGDELSVWVNPPNRPLTRFGQAVRKYVTAYSDTWTTGDVLLDVTGRVESDLVRYACQNEYCLPVWYSVKPGRYNVIIDINMNGVYDSGTDIIHGLNGQPLPVVVKAAPQAPLFYVSSAKPYMVKGAVTTITALVTDANDNPLSGKEVVFAVVSGPGTVSVKKATSGTEGTATTSLSTTLKDLVGEATVRATVTVDGKAYSRDCYVTITAPNAWAVGTIQ
jgi:hypothetical protein